MTGDRICAPSRPACGRAEMSAFGVESVERNGHRYHPGLSCLPTGVQEQVLAAHPDLNHRSAAGWPALRITRGEVSWGSVNDAPGSFRQPGSAVPIGWFFLHFGRSILDRIHFPRFTSPRPRLPFSPALKNPAEPQGGREAPFRFSGHLSPANAVRRQHVGPRLEGRWKFCIRHHSRRPSMGGSGVFRNCHPCVIQPAPPSS